MALNVDDMNNSMMREWLEKYTSIYPEQVDMLLDLIEKIGSDLSLLYNINKLIVQGQGYIEEPNFDVCFMCQDGISILQTSKERLELSNEEFRKIIGTSIDIYEDMLPLGTVVDLKKECFKNALPVDEVEHIRVVISHRFIPCSDEVYIPYMGNIYPIGNSGLLTNGLHFTPKVIEKIVHMGYIDEEEKAFLFQRKYELILMNNMHSSGFARKEEIQIM